MKVVAFSIAPVEKEYLAKANQKKHDITLISNSLDINTVIYAVDKDAVLVSADDDVSELVVEKLADMGVRYIATRSETTDHLDKHTAARYGVKLSNVPAIALDMSHSQTLQYTADQIIKNLDLWQVNKCVGKACVSTKGCKDVVAGRHHI